MSRMADDEICCVPLCRYLLCTNYKKLYMYSYLLDYSGDSVVWLYRFFSTNQHSAFVGIDTSEGSRNPIMLCGLVMYV